MRYSYEYKRKCVELYREGKWPEIPEGINNAQGFRIKVREWVRLEDLYGPEVLRHKSSNKVWTPEEKLELVSQVLAGRSKKVLQSKLASMMGTYINGFATIKNSDIMG